MSRPTLAIANRGEIAVRIARTARARGWSPVALLGEPDWDGYAAREISQVVRLAGGDELNPAAIVEAALSVSAAALHPGYGFLSERAELSTRCAAAGITFVGPSPGTLTVAGDKVATRQIAVERGVPVLEGSPALDLDDVDSWLRAANDIGYPIIAKVAGAGGGRGLRVARSEAELEGAIRSALNEAGGSGAESEIFLEHYLEQARHVEVQVAGDSTRAVALGDRDCSLQRRHQKVVEEAPAPGLSDASRHELHEAAVRLAEGISLLNLATVEFLVGADGRYFFMEINPRLQVEHTVTEAVTGLDLVALQFDLAAGGPLPAPVAPSGHAIQARLYAEDPFQQFLPSPGEILAFDIPRLEPASGARLRVDTGYEAGDVVPGNYDPMVAKLIVHAPTRDAALDGLTSALLDLRVAGIATNRPWLLAALTDDGRFRSDEHDLTTAATIQLETGPPSASELAALAGEIATASAGNAPGAWAAAGPFRIVAPATMAFHGDEHGGWQQTVHFPHANPGSSPSVTTARHEDGWELVTSRGRWLVREGGRPPAGKLGATLDGAIRAPMPGKLLEIRVAAGQEVAADEVVAVMEAMKIEISLAAPFAGVVSAIHSEPGSLVSTRQEIVTVEPATVTPPD